MGDERAGQLYARYGGAIFARCMRLLGDRAAAEDATQETFLKVHRHLGAAGDDGDSFAWIYRVATNHCLTVIRDRKPQGELPAELPAGGRSVEEWLADRDLAGRIVGRAPEKLRLPAWLHLVEGLSLDEVAKIMGVTTRTVTNRIAAFARSARKFAGESAP